MLGSWRCGNLLLRKFLNQSNVEKLLENWLILWIDAVWSTMRAKLKRKWTNSSKRNVVNYSESDFQLSCWNFVRVEYTVLTNVILNIESMPRKNENAYRINKTFNRSWFALLSGTWLLTLGLSICTEINSIIYQHVLNSEEKYLWNTRRSPNPVKRG